MYVHTYEYLCNNAIKPTFTLVGRSFWKNVLVPNVQCILEYDVLILSQKWNLSIVNLSMLHYYYITNYWLYHHIFYDFVCSFRYILVIYWSHYRVHFVTLASNNFYGIVMEYLFGKSVMKRFLHWVTWSVSFSSRLNMIQTYE